LEIRSPYDSDGIVEDWDAAARLWEYSITSRLTGARPTPATKNGLNDDKKEGDEAEDGDGDVAMEGIEEQEKPMSEHPLLMSEPAWNPAKHRAKCMEIALEDWGLHYGRGHVADRLVDSLRASLTLLSSILELARPRSLLCMMALFSRKVDSHFVPVYAVSSM
jgi:hypothetical protein